MKHRLDSLRKAKNTTIVKREREEIRMSSPHLGGRQQWSNHSLTRYSMHTLLIMGRYYGTTMCYYWDMSVK